MAFPATKRLVRSVKAASLALLDPYSRGDKVGELSELTSTEALEALKIRLNKERPELLQTKVRGTFAFFARRKEKKKKKKLTRRSAAAVRSVSHASRIALHADGLA